MKRVFAPAASCIIIVAGVFDGEKIFLHLFGDISKA